MTAWQDQPPQSRRQLRLDEQRRGAHDSAQNELNQDGRQDFQVQVDVDVAETPASQIETFARPGWDAPARRAVAAHEGQAPAAQQPRSRAEAAIASGRRSQHGFPHAAVPPTTEPSTTVPSTTVPSTERRADDASSTYRIRDFSPESRRSAFSSTSELAPSDWNRPGAAGEPANLDYYTQQGPGRQAAPQSPIESAPQSPTESAPVSEPLSTVVPVPQSASAAQPPLTPPSGIRSLAELRAAGRESQDPHPEHTLTRRELRAMREASAPVEEVSAPVEETSADAPSAAPRTGENVVLFPTVVQTPVQLPEAAQVPPPLRAPAAPAPQSSRELSDAMAEFDALMARDPGTDEVEASAFMEPSAGEPVSAHLPVEQPLVEQQPPVEQSVPAQPVAYSQAPEPSDSHNSDSDNSGNEPHGADIRTSESRDANQPYVVPTGHWSTQAELDNDAQLDGVTLSRNIGATSGAVTANHLVISSVPTASDLLLPFTPTGEIMVTGTIDLPRSLGTTGAHPARYDHSDVDALLEADDREDSNVDSAPVRAIRAVSTHTSSRGLIGTGKPPRSSRLPMVLAVSTAAVAAAVVVLFVAGFVLHLF